MINVGFIGCGAMGRDHVRRITDKCGNAQVVGVYDTVLGNAKQAIEDNRLDAMKTFVGDGQIGSLLMAGMRHYNAQASTSYYGEYLTRWGPGLLRLGAIMSFGGYCVSRPGLLRLGAVVG